MRRMVERVAIAVIEPRRAGLLIRATSSIATGVERRCERSITEFMQTPR